MPPTNTTVRPRAEISRIAALSHAGIIARREQFRGFHDIDQVMGNALPFGGRNFGGAYIEAAVNLQRIAIDDFCAQRARDAKGQVAFARARGP